MNLKEAFHYQNYLSSLLGRALNYLSDSSNITTTIQHHNRLAANPDAENEDRVVLNECKMKASADQLLKFVSAVMDEKTFLTNVIHEAKMKYSFAIDAELMNNRLRKDVADTLKVMANIKTGERIRTGTAYKFNAEGNQMPYSYEIVENVELDFDRGELRKMLKDILNECDQVSANADRMQVELEIDFDPLFDTHDSFEDAVMDFVSKK